MKRVCEFKDVPNHTKFYVLRYAGAPACDAIGFYKKDSNVCHDVSGEWGVPVDFHDNHPCWYFED
ncbi:hypothetical protein ZPAH1_orf00406 [Aeromonas phage ZPAH1]|nr:hypothetical protein ASwh1_359 [Aeromonas phage Aswh_1]QQG34168.1 hypothetical protein ZPAH1_orf00406 [Aeromonas phage ZPAH1]